MPNVYSNIAPRVHVPAARKPAAGISSSDLHKDNLQDKNQVVNIFNVDTKYDVRPEEEWYMSPSELTDPLEHNIPIMFFTALSGVDFSSILDRF